MRAFALRCLVLLLVAGVAYTAWLDQRVRSAFEGKRWAVPARIYARPLELYPGRALSVAALESELRLADYHAVDVIRRPGSYWRNGRRFELATRGFRFSDGWEVPRRVQLTLKDGKIAKLTANDHDLPLVRLDPGEIGRIYPTHHEDRELVSLDEVPPALVAALVAVEDRAFFEHHGISIRGVLRAAWANLRAGSTVQGGSTLTQQLAKNLFLTPRRSVSRKAHEALIAVLLEAHYSKAEILEAYLNEVFLGQQGRRAVHGFGLAARFYFARPLGELELPELATLVGLVRGASYYDPRRHPERSLQRRNLVLDLMLAQGLVTETAAHAARQTALGVVTSPAPATSRYPAYLDLVRRQLQRDYRARDLRSAGLMIFTALDPAAQSQAEAALGTRIRKIERERGKPAGRLQGAMVVTVPDSGEVLAVVGGRNARAGGFNRAIDAVRPIGSLVKPAVYLTALERPQRYTLASSVRDTAVEVKDEKGRAWRPQNYDGQSHGSVPLYAALARSYNQATVRLGLEIGVPRVVETLQRLGVSRPLEGYPSTLLGAVELSPIEVAQMYQTLASGGFFMPLRAIREVTDSDGRALSRYGLRVHQAVPAEANFLVVEALKAVMREGTGRSARRVLPKQLVVAGKTGTTDGLRDSWFAGFSRSHLAVAWLGHDDNTPAGLTGASGALTVWTDFMNAVPNRPLNVPDPPGIEWRWVRAEPNVEAGKASGSPCPGARRLPFAIGSGPPAVYCEKQARPSIQPTDPQLPRGQLNTG